MKIGEYVFYKNQARSGTRYFPPPQVCHQRSKRPPRDNGPDVYLTWSLLGALANFTVGSALAVRATGTGAADCLLGLLSRAARFSFVTATLASTFAVGPTGTEIGAVHGRASTTVLSSQMNTIRAYIRLCREGFPSSTIQCWRSSPCRHTCSWPHRHKNRYPLQWRSCSLPIK